MPFHTQMPQHGQNYQNPQYTGLQMGAPRQTATQHPYQPYSQATGSTVGGAANLAPPVSSLGQGWWGYQQPQQQQQQQAPQAPQPPSQGFQAQTSIQPQGVFPSQYTQEAGNLASAMAIPAHNDLYAAHSQPGISTASPMAQWGIGADVASGLANALMAPQQIGLQHQLQNSQHMLAGQQARDQEGLGWGRLGVQNLANQYGNQIQNQGSLLDALASLYQRWG